MLINKYLKARKFNQLKHPRFQLSSPESLYCLIINYYADVTIILVARFMPFIMDCFLFAKTLSSEIAYQMDFILKMIEILHAVAFLNDK